MISAMGTAHLDRDELDQAMECHQKDLAIAKRIKNEEAEGRALANTGRVYARQGNYNKVSTLQAFLSSLFKGH